MKPILLAFVLWAPVAALAAPRSTPAHAAPASMVAAAPPETLEFTPTADTLAAGPEAEAEPHSVEQEFQRVWLRPPGRDRLISDPDEWRAAGRRSGRLAFSLDYNRVDLVRPGATYQIQSRTPFLPRIGARIEYAFGRNHGLYGIQVEQPLIASGHLAIGASTDRVTDHRDLELVEDVENSLALLFARQDYRDYFEREGFGGYVAWTIPGVSTIRAAARRDDYRSLAASPEARSWFLQDHVLRPNPAVDDGQAHTLTLRLERQAHRTARTRAGLYHALELERAGYRLGGDFDYTRALGDVRGVVRLSPATSLALRGVAGHAIEGQLPAQKIFTLGGVDGLRAHSFEQYRGDQMLLGQAEYDVALWRMETHVWNAGLHVLTFVDVGRAWSNPAHRFDLDHQTPAVDGGFGLAASDDQLRVYVARNLQDSRSGVVISARLQRPF